MHLLEQHVVPWLNNAAVNAITRAYSSLLQHTTQGLSGAVHPTGTPWPSVPYLDILVHQMPQAKKKEERLFELLYTIYFIV